MAAGAAVELDADVVELVDVAALAMAAPPTAAAATAVPVTIIDLMLRMCLLLVGG